MGSIQSFNRLYYCQSSIVQSIDCTLSTISLAPSIHANAIGMTVVDGWRKRWARDPGRTDPTGSSWSSIRGTQLRLGKPTQRAGSKQQ
jgi:hypothetical protein